MVDYSSEHYEEKFEFPLWKLIKQRAQEKDISYVQATEEVLPEYVRTIRYTDKEFVSREIEKRHRELERLTELEKTGVQSNYNLQ
jgi:hypothetical protein